MHHHRRHIARIAGFTLVELMVSLGVVGAIAATQVPIYIEQELPQRQALEAKADVESIKTAANSYFMANGDWPAGLNSLINAGYLPAAWPTTGSPYSLSINAPTGANTSATLVVSIDTLSARQASYLNRQLPYATIATDGVTVETSMGQPTLGAIQANWLSRTYDNNCGTGGNDCNTMQTDIDAGGNNINNVASIDATRVEIVDPNAAANTPVASITASGSTLNLSDGVNVSGGLTVAGAIDAQDSLTVDGTLEAKNDLMVDGNLDAKNNVTVGGELHAKNDVTVDGDLNAKKNITVGGKLHAQNDLTVEGKLDAKKNVIVGGELHAKNDVSVEGNLDAKKNVTVGGGLYAKNGVSVEGDLDAKKNVTVGGKLHAKNNVTVDGDLDANKNVTVGGKLHAKNGVTVDGDLDAKKKLTVGGELYAKSDFTVDGDLDAKKNVTVGGKLHAKNDVTVEGNLNANGKVTIDGALHAKDSLTVDGTLQANQNLNVDGVLNAGVINADTLNADDASLTGALSASQIYLGTNGASISANGSTLNLGPSVNIAGDLGIQGDLEIAGDFGIGGDFTVSGTLTTDEIVTDTITLTEALNVPQLNVGNTSINSNGNTLNLNADTILINGKLKLGGTLNANNNNIIGVGNLAAASATITDLTATNATIKDKLKAGSAALGKTSITNGLTVSGATELQKLTATELNVTKGKGQGTFTNVNVSNQLTATNSVLANSKIGNLEVTGDADLNSLTATSANISGKITAKTADIKVSEFDTLYVNKYLYAKKATLAKVKATNVTTDFLTTGSFSATSVNVSGAFNVGGTLKAQNATINGQVTANSLESANSGLGTATATSLNVATLKAADIDATTVKGGSFTAHSYTASDDFTTANSSVNTNKTLIDKYAALWDACQDTGGCK